MMYYVKCFLCALLVPVVIISILSGIVAIWIISVFGGFIFLGTLFFVGMLYLAFEAALKVSRGK